MLDLLYPKITAYILLNGWSIIPFVHAIKWRMVYNSMTSEEMNAIMEAGIDTTALQTGMIVDGSLNYPT